MKVDVIVSLYQGVLDGVQVYSDFKKADAVTNKWLEEHGYKTYEEYLDALANTEHNHEIHHYQDVEVIE